MIAKASQRSIHVSPKKAKYCCRLIVNQPVDKALRILSNQPQKTARYLSKLLLSAASNAVHNHAMQGNKLYVYRSVANTGIILKRTIPRAKGRADLLRKRYSNLEVWVSDDPLERTKRNSLLLRPRAHQGKYKKILDEKGVVEIMPKLIVKKQQEG